MSNLHTLYGTARARQSCCALLLLLCSTSSFALGLGELRNQHNLGERFSAQVELVAPPERGTPLMVRLASAEEYQRNDLIYPTDLRFKFVVQNNEAGQAALILISSTQAVQEPFVQLLLDVSYPGARVLKAFTVLLDPPHLAANTFVPVVPEVAVAQPSIAFAAALPPVKLEDVPVVAQASAGVAKPVPAQAGRTPKNRPPKKPSQAKPARAAATPYRSLLEHDEAPATPTTPATPASTGLKLAISTELTTSLHISKLEPHNLATPSANEDALQEELIAKNKTLQELTLQVSEMQAVIAALKNAGGASAVSAVSVIASAASQPLASSAVDNTVNSSGLVTAARAAEPVQMLSAAPVVDELVWWQSTAIWLWLACGLALLGGAYAWWTRRELADEFQHSIFDDLHAAQMTAQEHDNPFTHRPVSVERRMTDTVQIGDVSMKVPAYKAPIPSSNPEYDLLEQADIYLQFGHDKLAEEVLQEALLINPRNEQIYLTLLDIYDTRNDAVKFAEFASELENYADKKIWERVCKMGKRIDPDNELYGLHLTKADPSAANLHGGHIDNEFGELHVTHPPKFPSL